MSRPVRPLVTALITTYNRAALLREALDSVLAQEGAGEDYDLEVVVVDDGSTDQTPDVVARYPGVRYIRLDPNRGPPAALNAGLAASRGHYIAFLDDDDVWLPRKLRLQVPVLEADTAAGVAYSQFYRLHRGTRVLLPKAGRTPSGDVFLWVLREYKVYFISALVRREALAAAGPFDESLPMSFDFDLCLRLARRFPFRFVPGVVGVVRPGAGLTAAHADRIDAMVRTVLERGVAMVPEGATRAALRREVLARHELGMALHHLEWTGDLDRMVEHFAQALEAAPELASEEVARTTARAVTWDLARNADDPLRAVSDLAHRIQEEGNGTGRRGAWRRLVAEMWTTAALAWAARPSPRIEASGHAAAHALRLAPRLVRRRALVWFLVRALVSHPRALLPLRGSPRR